MKKKSEALRTIKLRYFAPDNRWPTYHDELARQQSNATRFAYQRFNKDGMDRNQVNHAINAIDNNSMPEDSHFVNSAVIRANGIYDSALARGQKKLTFKQKAFEKYRNEKINKKQLKEERLFTIYSVGEKNNKGNRKYNFLSPKTLEFKPNSKDHFTFHLEASRNQTKYLTAIWQLANAKETPITVAIDKDFIYLTFDIGAMANAIRPNVQNRRVAGIDMNPNEFGFVIKDNNVIYKAEKLDFMDLRLYTCKGFASDSDEKKYLNNKKNHEVIEAAYYVIEQAVQFHCEAVSLEQLNGMQSRNKGRHFNRAVNNDFKRNLFRSTIKKLCAERNIKFIEVAAAYTSFWGHVIYHDRLSDPCTAAACVADAGIIALDQLAKGEKRKDWYQQVKIARLLCAQNSYLNQWNEKDMRTDSVRDLYESVKSKIGKGGMYKSYHVSYQAVKTNWFNCSGSSVTRALFI